MWPNGITPKKTFVIENYEKEKDHCLISISTLKYLLKYSSGPTKKGHYCYLQKNKYKYLSDIFFFYKFTFKSNKL
jgi:hypothetical protein